MRVLTNNSHLNWAGTSSCVRRSIYVREFLFVVGPGVGAILVVLGIWPCLSCTIFFKSGILVSGWFGLVP